MASELQVFVLVRVTVNSPPVRITRNWYSCQCECGLKLASCWLQVRHPSNYTTV